MTTAKDYLVYDVEVFAKNSMAVFKDLEGKTVKVFSSCLDGLGEYIDKGIVDIHGYKNLEEYIKDKVLIGYNNYHYDDYILYAMILVGRGQFEHNVIKAWNDSIIGNGSLVNMRKIDNKTIDCFQQVDISKPSLKKIEGNMGKSIIESSVDFRLERELTPKENLETLKYCEYDVLNTLEVYKMRHEYFDSKKSVVDMLDDEDLKEKAMTWNTTSIVGQLLKPKYRLRQGMHVDEKFLSYVDNEVLDMWQELRVAYGDFNFKKKKVVHEEFGNVIEFGWGGLHGAPKGFVKAQDIKLMDVNSMYPNILINLDGLQDKTETYKTILDRRLKLKKEGKKKEQAPYKLILNSTYGLLNNQYSQLNNPYLAYSICINGQIAVYELAKRLAHVGARVLNINTDGVAYTIDNNYDMRIKEDWEKEFNLTLGVDRFKTWIQKDVNNYIAVTDTGKIKVKGGDVNKYDENKYFANNDIRITHIALVDKLVYGKSVAESIVENLDNPLLYQYILQAGSTYKGVVMSKHPDKLLNTKINRVFACKNGIEILKKRQDDGLVKFADAPSHMYLYNGDLSEFKDFKRIVDKQWYVDLVNKNLKRWE
jgi:hypothetical protein|nr:MAG TPA: DNA polymerase [Caudoviricetes sp.]